MVRSPSIDKVNVKTKVEIPTVRRDLPSFHIICACATWAWDRMHLARMRAYRVSDAMADGTFLEFSRLLCPHSAARLDPLPERLAFAIGEPALSGEPRSRLVVAAVAVVVAIGVSIRLDAVEAASVDQDEISVREIDPVDARDGAHVRRDPDRPAMISVMMII